MRLATIVSAIAAFTVAFACAPDVKAGFETDHVEISIPTSAWLVGPAMVTGGEKAPARIPCIMMNQFGSGETVRVSAGGGRVYAIAINFGQRLFDKAQPYMLELTIGDQYFSTLEALAYSDDTLLLSIEEDQGFYEAFKGGKTMYIGMDNDTLDLALIGVKEGLKRVEQCYDGTGNVNMGEQVQVQARQDRQHVPPAGMITPMPGAQPVSDLPAKNLEEQQQVVNQLVDDLLQVSEDQSAQNPGQKNVKDGPVSVSGGRLAQNWASPDMPQQPEAVPPQPSKTVVEPAAVVQPGQIRTWRAIRGTNLREIVDVWALKENVRVVWMAGNAFTVQESLSVQGKFEEAILTVLNQFGSEEPRPVGKIYKDPRFNQRVLLVESKEDY